MSGITKAVVDGEEVVVVLERKEAHGIGLGCISAVRRKQAA